MKTNFLKNSLWLAAMLLTSLCVNAQTKKATKTASTGHTSSYSMNSDGQLSTTRAEIEYEGKTYRLKMVDDKITSLYVDDEKIPEADWNKYSDAIAHIRKEIKEQTKRNEEQAKRNAEQAVRNQEQAGRNQEQAKRNAEQNVRNEQQAKKNAEQALVNGEQAKRNAEQNVRNGEQAKKNAEQAARNQLQAKKNEEQAKKNEQFIKDITNDLYADKIIPSVNSLNEMRLNRDGMTVNGVKQPEEVFKKYKAKYSKSFDGEFSFSNNGIIRSE